MRLYIRNFPLSLSIATLMFAGCGGDNGVTEPPVSDGIYWANYIDQTLPSGFKLVSLNGQQRTAAPLTTPANQAAALNFAVDPDYRSNRGWLFRGHDHASDFKQDLAGAAEFVKQGGRLRVGETFDWDRSTRRYTQPPLIRLTFIGYAGDLMITYLSEPYIAFPADTTKTWTGPPVNVSDASGTSFVEIFSYRIHYLGKCDLMENTRTLASYDDVIRIEGTANMGQGLIDAYLAPNVGIIYYHLVTAFGQEGAAALIGFSGENLSITGTSTTDYFPTAPGNHWIYEFSPDDHVPQFRFGVKQVP